MHWQRFRPGTQSLNRCEGARPKSGGRNAHRHSERDGYRIPERQVPVEPGLCDICECLESVQANAGAAEVNAYGVGHEGTDDLNLGLAEDGRDDLHYELSCSAVGLDVRLNS